MHFIIVFLLPVSLCAKETHNELFNRFLHSLVTQNEAKLSDLLHENFTIQDCKGLKIGDRESVIKELQKFPDVILISMKSFSLVDIGESHRFHVNVNNEMITEFRLVPNGTSFVIFSERQSKCLNSTFSWYFTSLIDYDTLFKNVANGLVTDFCAVLNDDDKGLNTILDKNYNLFTCESKKINRQTFINELRKLQGRAVYDGCHQGKADNVIVNEVGELKFVWERSILFKAAYSNEDRKYKITSEHPINCTVHPFLSLLIDDYQTGYQIAEHIGLKYYNLSEAGNLGELVTGPIALFECMNKTTTTTLSIDEFAEKYPVKESRPRDSDDVVLFTLRHDFSEGRMSFFIYPERQYPRITFKVDLKKNIVRLVVTDKKVCEL